MRKKTAVEFVGNGTKKVIIFTIKVVLCTALFYGGTSFFVNIYGWLAGATEQELITINKFAPLVLSVLTLLYLAESYKKGKWYKKYLTILFCFWISMPIFIYAIVKIAYFIHSTEIATELLSIKYQSLKIFPITFIISFIFVKIIIFIQDIFSRWTIDHYEKEKERIMEGIRFVEKQMKEVCDETEKFELKKVLDSLLLEKLTIEQLIEEVT